MKLYKAKRLLNIDNNAKTIKGQKLKVKTKKHIIEILKLKRN